MRTDMLPSRTVRFLLPAAALAVAFTGSRQDPVPAPQEPTPPPPLAQPAPHPFEGVYQLRRRVIVDTAATQPCTGYLAITKRHLFLCVAAPGTDPELPLLRAGVRTWTAKADQLQMAVQLGWYTDADGNVKVETPGTTEKRSLELLRGLVRLHQDGHSYLEFERVE